MKLVVLDVDGVLNAMPRTWLEGHRPRLQPECVALLHELLERTDARVCVSSTWRIGDGYHQLVDHLVRMGIARYRFVGRTPDHYPVSDGGLIVAQRRGQEIQAWLNAHPVSALVILDDDDDMGPLLPYLVQTAGDEGLTRANLEHAGAMLMEAYA